ncbi:MAG: MmgE/PrpD family protein [Deltaproteobacteria bacterium]|nr:MmgE/PrpD family protein [Deltaproteobacteria bacterium]
MGPTMALAEFLAKLKFEDIPSRCLEQIKVAFLDSLGCGLFGSTLEWSQKVNSLVKEMGGKEEATLWVNDFRGPAANVALGLGTMIHSFDFDDYHNAKLHPGAVVVPAALTMAEREGSSGKEFLTAMVAGYETMIRISLATGPGASRQKGWHLTGTCGTFGAAAATGKLLHLEPQGMASALGMAGTQSAGLWAFTADGSESKRFHPGRSAQSGIIAALLAKRGYRGPTQILEAKDGGFCQATSDFFNLDRLTSGLGKKFEAEDVVLKPYSCCGSLHSTIDATRALAQTHKIKLQEVAKIRVHNSQVVKLQCGFEYEPMGPLQAQMSLQYCTAISLLDGQVLVDQFKEERLADPKVIDLARRVEFVLDPEIDAIYPERFASKVEIVLKDGQSLWRRVDYPKGSPENPMTTDEIEDKFKALARTVKDQDTILSILKLYQSLEELKDLSPLIALLR